MEFGGGEYIFTRCMLKKAFWFIVLLSVGSCLEKPDCFQLNNNYIGITFRKLFDGKADTLSFIGITTSTTDSVFYAFKAASSIQLELNPFISSTDFKLETIFGSHDLDVGYSSAIQFVSDECGIRTTLSDLTILKHSLDSLRIKNPRFTNPAQQNLEVLRCPRTNLLKLAFRRLQNGVQVADSVQLSNVTADYGTPFYFPGGKITRINLPLNTAANSTTFTFTFSDASVKTLTVQHTRTTWDELAPCQPMIVFSKLANAGSTFGQVNLLRDSIHDPPLTNFAIFR